MYIGKVTVNNEWKKLDTLVKEQVAGQSSFAFDADTTYQLQGEGNYGIRFCVAANIPTDPAIGNYTTGSQTALFKPETGKELFVKAIDGRDAACPVLHISSLVEA